MVVVVVAILQLLKFTSFIQAFVRNQPTLVALGEVQVLYSDGVRKRRLVGCLVPV